MTTGWLAFLSCALISIPSLAAPAALAQSPGGGSTVLIPSTPVSSPAPAVTRVNLDGNDLQGGYRLNVADRFTTAALTAPEPESDQMRLAFTNHAWTSQDAVFIGDTQRIDSGNDPSAASDKANCRWSFGVANDWTCKIEPLTKFDFPGRHVLHSLWPLHGRNDGQ